MTHTETINKVCLYMRAYGWACFPEIPLYSTCKCDVPIPDVMAIKRNFVRKSIAIFEIKVSRADFLQEVKRKKFLKSVPFADRFYYACPDGLLKPEEIPEGCGLYYVDNYRMVCIKNAKPKKVELTVDTLWSIILSYETKYNLRATYK